MEPLICVFLQICPFRPPNMGASCGPQVAASWETMPTLELDPAAWMRIFFRVGRNLWIHLKSVSTGGDLGGLLFVVSRPWNETPLAKQWLGGLIFNNQTLSEDAGMCVPYYIKRGCRCSQTRYIIQSFEVLCIALPSVKATCEAQHTHQYSVVI